MIEDGTTHELIPEYGNCNFSRFLQIRNVYIRNLDLIFSNKSRDIRNKFGSNSRMFRIFAII